jgi:hypothetical protein
MEESAMSQPARPRLRTGMTGLVRPDSGLEPDEETINQPARSGAVPVLHSASARIVASFGQPRLRLT